MRSPSVRADQSVFTILSFRVAMGIPRLYRRHPTRPAFSAGWRAHASEGNLPGSSGARVHVTTGMPWDDDLLGARASRPHKAWHNLGSFTSIDREPRPCSPSAWLMRFLPVCRPSRSAEGWRGRARWQGQDAGDARAPGGCRPAARWGVSGGRLLKNLACTPGLRHRGPSQVTHARQAPGLGR